MMCRMETNDERANQSDRPAFALPRCAGKKTFCKSADCCEMDLTRAVDQHFMLETHRAVWILGRQAFRLLPEPRAR
jgi:hypothetical protein